MKNLFAFACLFSLVLFSPGCGEKSKSDSKTSSVKTGDEDMANNDALGGGAPGGGGYDVDGAENGDGNNPMGAGTDDGMNPNQYNTPPMGMGSGNSGSGPGSIGSSTPNPEQYNIPPEENPVGSANPMPDPAQYNTPPGGSGNPMPMNPGENIPPTENPGGSKNPMGTPSYGGDSGAAGGTGSPRKAQAPDYPAGSAESAVISLIKNLAKKDYKGNADLISSSAKGILQDLRSSKPSAQTISRANSMMGAVRLSKKNATQLPGGAQRFTLINSSGLILRFRCIKENGKFVISELTTERGGRRRR